MSPPSLVGGTAIKWLADGKIAPGFPHGKTEVPKNIKSGKKHCLTDMLLLSSEASQKSRDSFWFFYGRMSSLPIKFTPKKYP